MERGELFSEWFVLDVKFRIILLILAKIYSIHFGVIFDKELIYKTQKNGSKENKLRKY